MNKAITCSMFAVIFALAFTACAAPPASAPEPSPLVELSRAVRDVSYHLNSNIPAGRMIAFVNVQSGSAELSNFIIDDLIANAVTDRIFTVVDRQRLDYIRAEQNIQLSGEVDDETARSIGGFLGAHTIVSGRVSSFGGYFRLTIRALDVETAEVQGQYNRVIGTERAMTALMRSGGGQVPAWQTVQTPVAQVPAAQTVQGPSPVQAQPAAPPVASIRTPEPRLENGRRTFHPRPQAHQGARAVASFVYYIVVRNEYMTIHLRSTATGDFSQTMMYGFGDKSRVLLQDLDSPGRSFVPVQRGGTHWNNAWVTFRNVNAMRLSLVCTVNTPRIVFDEIRIGDPD